MARTRLARTRLSRSRGLRAACCLAFAAALTAVTQVLPAEAGGRSLPADFEPTSVSAASPTDVWAVGNPRGGRTRPAGTGRALGRDDLVGGRTAPVDVVVPHRRGGGVVGRRVGRRVHARLGIAGRHLALGRAVLEALPRAPACPGRRRT